MPVSSSGRMNDDRGGRVQADELVEPAPLEDRHGGAERDADRQQETEGGLERHQDRAEHQDQQHERESDDDEQVDREHLGKALGDVDAHRGLAGHQGSGAGLVGQRRRTGRGCVSTRSLVAASEGPLVGTTVMVANSTAASCCSYAVTAARRHSGRRGRDDGGDVLLYPGASRDRRVDRGGGVVGVLGVDHDDERAVGAVAEVLGDQVVGAGGCRCRPARCRRRGGRAPSRRRGSR